MTVQMAAQVRPAQGIRRISRDLFGRTHQLEVAFTAATLEPGFVLDDLIRNVQDRAEAAGLELPKESSVRKNSMRLVDAGALDMLPSSGPGSPARYTAVQGSPFWALALELDRRS